MPILKRISNSFGKRWTRKSKRNLADDNTKSSKKRVRFDPEPLVIPSTYNLTEEIHKDCWFRKKDFVQSQATIETITNKAAVDFGTLNKTECHRGLEQLIRDKVSRSTGAPSSKTLYSKFVRGLIELQRIQLLEGGYDEVEIRNYSLRHSQKKSSLAELVGASDALCAGRIYEESCGDWPMSIKDGSPEPNSERQLASIRGICRRNTLPSTSHHGRSQ